MIQGAPNESRWFRPHPRRAVPSDVLREIVSSAFPGCSAIDVQPLPGGLRNANFRIQLNSTPTYVVLRIYEHDASLCRKEMDLLALVRQFVPVPEVIYAEPSGIKEVPPFVLLSHVEGISFSDLESSGDANRVSQAAYDVGRTLALIGRIEFSNSGWLGPGPSAISPLLEAANPSPRFVDLCLNSGNVLQRMAPKLRNQVSDLVWSNAAELASLDKASRLVHGDFGNRNLLVRKISESWAVAAVLDWEFAIAGSPLIDVGHFLRYETLSHPKVEPHFSNAYLRTGGWLPDGWRRLARIVDLTALCESLTHEALPSALIAELIELVSATVEDRDPRFS